jgi:(1->4)-alpha-D-glucan 1-alpha-D-glucosylmutase
MAKAIEDTLFYRDIRLLALNEVGGDPEASGLAPGEFHRRMTERQTQSGGGLTATATHDTKRGEDARLRIAALSEMSENWMAAVRRWLAANDADRSSAAPTRAHEYLLYQSLIGVWDLGGISPGLVARLQAYAVKAARESKTVTSWMQPDEAYEDRLRAFVADLLDLKTSATFIAEFEPLARRAALLGALYSLGQLTLKATMPGVPDFYQGTEFWDLSLVDPDNRRPVDFAARAQLLTELNGRPDWHHLCQTWQNGSVKLALTRALLAARVQHATIFDGGDYVEIPVRDDATGAVVAFARTGRAGSIVVAVCTRLAALTRGGREWPDFTKIGGFLRLPSGQGFDNILDDTRRQIHQGDAVLKDLFGPLPVAVLVSRG